MADHVFRCPHCQMECRVLAELAGESVTCPNPDCLQAITIPPLPGAARAAAPPGAVAAEPAPDRAAEALADPEQAQEDAPAPEPDVEPETASAESTPPTAVAYPEDPRAWQQVDFHATTAGVHALRATDSGPVLGKPPAPPAPPSPPPPLTPTPPPAGPTPVRTSSYTPAGGGWVQQQTEPLAIIALVLGILGALTCCCCPWIGLPIGGGAVISGHVASSRIRNHPELTGDSLALVGTILGYVAVALNLVYLVLQLLNLTTGLMQQ